MSFIPIGYRRDEVGQWEMFLSSYLSLKNKKETELGHLCAKSSEWRCEWCTWIVIKPFPPLGTLLLPAGKWNERRVTDVCSYAESIYKHYMAAGCASAIACRHPNGRILFSPPQGGQGYLRGES